jgi:hypothetical protein
VKLSDARIGKTAFALLCERSCGLLVANSGISMLMSRD